MIDVNAYLGHFAFRQLRHNTPDALLRLMDAKGIEQAMVSSISAVTYRNTQPANEDLFAAVKPYRDRLISLGVVNPSYAGWQDDLKMCHDEFGMKGLRLYPKWHNYALADACANELVSTAAERGMLLSIPLRVEDYRQRSWLVDVPDVPHAEIVDLVKKHPGAKFILVNGAGFSSSALGRASEELPTNYWIEISRLSALMANEIGQLVSQLGANRLVFGTGMPLKYPDPATLKLEVLDATTEVKDRIRSGNAAELLGHTA
ncbi:MAG: amidohydrolase family protein [Thermoguttaceae bacterium]|jgi:predicted TIM-barrel fold metal-dependent hydrolase|nr:amidohydrolase family protein [Thermoguttaceae bacterium]